MKQLDPKAIWLFFIGFVLRWLIIALILGFYAILAVSEIDKSISFPEFLIFNLIWWFGGIFVFLILGFVWAKLTYYFYRYELTDAGFRKELGIIYKKYTTIPYSRIQNVDIYRGIMARILGLSDLQIQTAGMSAVFTRFGVRNIGAEGRLPGLSREIAEQLRDELIKRAKESKNQGL